MQVVDHSVVMNDGRVGVFDLTLWDDENGCNATARVSYSLKLDFPLIPPDLPAAVREAVLQDEELREEMKEAIAARRDALRDMN